MNKKIKNNIKVPCLPMENFFRNPEKTAFKFSPDGKYLSYLQPWKNRLNIYVEQIADGSMVQITQVTERDIAGYFWANNSRIAYLKDTGGDEDFKLYAVNIDGTELKELTPFPGVRTELIDDLKDNEKEIIIGLNKRNPQFFDAYRVNVYTGEMDLIAENPGNISGWMTDHEGRLRVAVTTDGVNSSLLYRDQEGQPFRSLITTNFRDTIAPLQFTYDNQRLYVSSNLGRDLQAIYEYDPQLGKEVKLIYENSEVDVSVLLTSDKNKKITGVAYVTDKLHYYFFDREREEIQQFLEKKLPGYEISIASMNREEDKILVRTYSDKSRGAYYYYDLHNGEFKKIVEVSPWLTEEFLADMEPITFSARDGMVIHGYLTLPRTDDSKHLSVVVNPHGGPWARDVWGFNPEVQFLANRGYAIFQVNFRGSTGYGRKFWEAGFKQWGRKMQDDITDGVKWLIQKGIADPKRIAIYGGSYGGYAVLAGLTFTPDLYAAGIDYVGVSNIFTLLETIPPYWEQGRQMLYEMIGDPEKDRDLLQSASPVFHADKIRAPLLVAQGANDPRVKKAESDQIVEALRHREVDVKYIVKENEGHGFRNEENRFDFYREMEQFLAKHLDGMIC
jgi:dipeptidyl aminopeptidase/acylaminoacyl peptidase